MTRAAEEGFHYGSPDWSNLGQGAPEVGTRLVFSPSACWAFFQ